MAIQLVQNQNLTKRPVVFRQCHIGRLPDFFGRLAAMIVSSGPFAGDQTGVVCVNRRGSQQHVFMAVQVPLRFWVDAVKSVPFYSLSVNFLSVLILLG